MDEKYFRKRIKYRESIGGEPDLKVYKDKEDNLTAGWGHKLTKDEMEIYKEHDTVSIKQVKEWFEKDIAASMAITKNDPWIATLPESHQFVLHDMAYNMGAAKMKGTAPKGFKRFFRNMKSYAMSTNDKDKTYYSKRAYNELRFKNPYGVDGLKDMRNTEYWGQVGGRARENAVYIVDPKMKMKNVSTWDDRIY